MKNQFFYTIQQNVGTEEVPEFKETQASLNVDMVTRTVELVSGELTILLNDFHEELVTMPNTINVNTNKVIHGKKEKAIVQSQITISIEDKERFINLTTI